MKRLFSALSLVAIAAGFGLMIVDGVYRASTAGIYDHTLHTMEGWTEIADEHPTVVRGLIPGMYSVVTADGTVYDVNLSAEPALRNLLDRLADE